MLQQSKQNGFDILSLSLSCVAFVFNEPGNHSEQCAREIEKVVCLQWGDVDWAGCLDVCACDATFPI